MRFFLVLSCFFVCSKAFSNPYRSFQSVCNNTGTVVLGDPYKSRSLVLNYNPTRDKMVILRCGTDNEASLSRSARTMDCHVVRQGSFDEICNSERTSSRVARVMSEVISTGTSSIITGGLSNIQKFQKAINLARSAGIEPSCLGAELIRSLTQNSSNQVSIHDMYYNNLVELSPIADVERLLRRNSPNMRAQTVFAGLNNLGVGHGPTNTGSVNLRGPSYFTLERSRSSMEAYVDRNNVDEFCRRLGSTPTANYQSYSPTDRASSSSID